MTQQTQHRKIETIAGFFVSIFSFIVYLATSESTVAFWDCGEFIAAAYRLQIPHAPGAPLYLLVARFFTLFAPSSDLVAFAVTTVSAASSAATVGVVFLIISHITKLWWQNWPIAIIGAITGSLSLAFSDSFWTSATEAEVYSLANLFLVLILWAAFKFREGPHHSRFRYILLISFLLGCATGVHFLCLLVIPAAALIIGYKEHRWKRNILVVLFGLLLTIGIERFIVPGPFLLAEWLEVFMVNNLGWPYLSGVLVVFVLLLIVLLVISLYLNNRVKTKSASGSILHLIVLSLFFLLLGSSTHIVTALRAQANVPLNEGAPDDCYSMQAYLARDQFGQGPVLYGPQYTAPIVEKDGNLLFKDGEPEYGGYGQEGYLVVSENQRSQPVYDSSHNSFFPRLHSKQPQHIRAYKRWAAIPDNQKGKPTFVQNLRFFINYQLGHQFFRYLLWNFVGRQNNFQGEGGPINGNWITGIDVVDSLRGMGVSSQILSDSDPRTRSVFYGIPLLLGIIGLFVNFNKEGRSAYAILTLFLITGPALVVFLNQTPLQPRERDYIFIGTFIAFFTWAGIGGAYISEQFRKCGGTKLGLMLGLVISLTCPTLMLANGWKPHQKSHRYLVREMAFNYLRSCPPNTILFTQGDNDTYPLWYAQQVEGFRTDVRVINISLQNTDWFLDQLRNQQFDSAPIRFSIDQKHFRGDRLLYIPYLKDLSLNKSTPLQGFVDYVVSEHDSTRFRGVYSMKDRIPSTKVHLVLSSETDHSMDTMSWDIDRSYILKSDLAILDIIASNLTDRPIAFAASCGSSSKLGLTNYLRPNGLAYILSKTNTPSPTNGVEVHRLQENASLFQSEFSLSALSNPSGIFDEEAVRISWMYRDELLQTARSLIESKDERTAVSLLDHSLSVIPSDTYFLGHIGAEMALLYLEIGETDKGMDLLKDLLNQQLNRLELITHMEPKIQKTVGHTLESTLSEVEFLFLSAKGKGLMGELKDEEIRFKQLSKVFLES